MGLVLGCLALAVAWLLVLLRAAHQWPRDSDNAWQVLLGAEIVRGNWDLAGWSLTPYTTWTTELPIYAAGVWLRGTDPNLMFEVPALLYAAMVAVASCLAAQGWRAGRAALSAGATLVLLGLPTPFLAMLALEAGVPHMGTLVAALGCIAATAWGIGKGGSALAYGIAFVALFAAITGDPLALVTGTLPVLAGSVLQAARTRRWLPYLLPAGVAAVASLLGQLVRSGIVVLGGFHYVGLTIRAAPLEALRHNLHLLRATLLLLFGADGQVPAVVAAMGVLTMVGLVGLASAHALGRWLALEERAPKSSWLDLVLLLALAANVAAFTLSDRPENLGSARYLVPSFVFGSILLGRFLPYLTGRRSRLLLALAAAVAATRVASFVPTLMAPAAPTPAASAEAWLLAHHLGRGFGPFWDSPIITVETGGRVQVATVISDGSHLAQHQYLSKTESYRRSAVPLRFLIYRIQPPANGAGGIGGEKIATFNNGVGGQVAIDTFGQPVQTVTFPGARLTVWSEAFGPPSKTESLGDYRVLVWDHDLSGELRPPQP